MQQHVQNGMSGVMPQAVWQKRVRMFKMPSHTAFGLRLSATCLFLCKCSMDGLVRVHKEGADNFNL